MIKKITISLISFTIISIFISCESPKPQKLIGEWEGYSDPLEAREPVFYTFNSDGSGEFTIRNMTWVIKNYSLNEERSPAVLTLELDDPFGDSKTQNLFVEFISSKEIIIKDNKGKKIILYLGKGRLASLEETALRKAKRKAQKNAMIFDCAIIASDSRIYFKKPIALGGGGSSFKDYKIPTYLQNTSEGKYSSTLNSDNSLSIVGISKSLAGDSLNLIKVSVNMFSPSLDGDLIIEDPMADKSSEKLQLNFYSDQKFILKDQNGQDVQLEVSEEILARMEKEKIKNVGRDGLLSDCMNLASRCQQYYNKPKTLGGGGHSFMEYKIPANLQKTHNGTYSASVMNDKNLQIIGIGKVVGNDNINPVKVIVTISPNKAITKVVN
ncbi:MAG: hypothetical protein IH950_08545 [Bacteroidetes bacterium]|nr:hypothetical protein [Bacteroidota bacterium]